MRVECMVRSALAVHPDKQALHRICEGETQGQENRWRADIILPPQPMGHTCRQREVGISQTLSVPSIEALSSHRPSELTWRVVIRSL